MADTSSRRAGDSILDHYLPEHSAEAREAAHASLRRLAQLLIRVHERGAREIADRTIRAKDTGTLDSKASCHGI